MLGLEGISGKPPLHAYPYQERRNGEPAVLSRLPTGKLPLKGSPIQLLMEALKQPSRS